MEELIHFKLFLHIRGKQEEVRRFSCESNVDIGKLNAYIKEKFVHLGDKEFVLKWEDEDGDKVDINSQQELRLAMQEMKKIGPVYKLQIHILENPWWKQGEKNSEKSFKNCSGEEHSGIICFCCHQQVRGFRYKCVICPNYEMCGSCEDKAMHPAHDMVRIPSPRSYPPHFFLRLHRLYERCNHSSPTMVKPGCSPLSSANEQMAKDLLDDDSSDISDLELEVSLLPEGNKGSSTTSSLLTRKRVNSDPGGCSSIEERNATLEKNRQSFHLMSEHLPSFEELTKSMQDLAEKDLDEYFESTVDCRASDTLKTVDTKLYRKSYNNDVTKPTIGNHKTMQLQSNLCLPKVELEQNNSIALLDNSETLCGENKQETSVGKSCANNNMEDVIDTSESLRNIQQEIESLLAPLTPLPDLEAVPKAIKTSDDKELFMLMNNRNISQEKEKERAGSFEILDNSVNQFFKSKSMDDWSLLGEKQSNDNQNEGKETALDEDVENESSETETEDHVESDDDCNGNVYEKKTKNDEYKKDNQMTLSREKSIADEENFESESFPTFLAASICKTEINCKSEDAKEQGENFVEIKSVKVDEEAQLKSRFFVPHSAKISSKVKSEYEAESSTNCGSSGSRRHYNPRVADALDKMVGMGFTDDDGWLTQLLVMKHGDISQVLDILTPVRK